MRRMLTHDDSFPNLLQAIVQQVPSDDFAPAAASDQDLSDWGNILLLFRHNAIDSCKALLRKYDYQLIEIHDPISGNTYDVFKEEYPIQRGWGTFIYNRNHKKRLYMHVTHPFDDFNTLVLGGDLLRRLNAEWLFVTGTSKASQRRSLRNTLRARSTVFHRWHEMLTDLTHLTLSLHGFNTIPGRTPDIVVSNGRTSDEQWGISQISVAFRDTMRASGFNCMLAMYDSGYAQLAGRASQEGIFSNDSVGFGHWLNIELSSALRVNRNLRQKLILAADRALELTGKKVSHQVNRAFGLVSPRVVHIDAAHRMLFPPPAAETYRIVSFNASDKRDDTIDVRMGNWLDTFSGQKNMTSVTRLDSANNLFSSSSRRRNTRATRTRILEEPLAPVSAMMQFNSDPSDSSLLGEVDQGAREPLQVHRIPLKKVPVPSYASQIAHRSTPFSWNGILSGRFAANMPVFQMSTTESEPGDADLSAKFLIPLVNSSYRASEEQFVGIHMTEVLVSEIARLVNEYEMTHKDIGLLAERSEGGDYYLRIFPGSLSSKAVRNSVK